LTNSENFPNFRSAKEGDSLSLWQSSLSEIMWNTRLNVTDLNLVSVNVQSRVIDLNLIGFIDLNPRLDQLT